MMTISANEITQQALGFQKSTFAFWYDAVSAIQDRTVAEVEKLLNQTIWIPDEGRKVISSWVASCKKERERYRVYMEESFSVLEKHFSAGKKDAPVRADKAEGEKRVASAMKSKGAADEEKKPLPH
jgi:hypothetical protein